MPMLPDVEVSTRNAQRIIAAFQGEKNDQGVELTPQQAYRRWLLRSLAAHVLAKESEGLTSDFDTL